jgi:hypothetical protein
MQREVDLREILERTKGVVDEIYAKQPNRWGGIGEMILFLPATDDQIEAFRRSEVGSRFPRSYTSVHRASNGVEYGWDRVCILSVDSDRREKWQAHIADVINRHEKSFRLFKGEINDENIAAWESDPNKMFLRRHCIAGVQPGGGLLVYDERTRQADGEMELCHWHLAKAGITERYANIETYVATALRLAEEYAAALAPKRKRK